MSADAWVAVGSVVWLAIAFPGAVILGRSVRVADEQQPQRPDLRPATREGAA